MEAGFRAPCRGLVPGDLAESLEAGSLGGGASFSLSCADDAPSLSDRIVTIEGDAEQQEQAFRQVLQQLCEAQDTKEAETSLFVALVPCSAAAAVVGTRGQRVQALIKRSGAQIEVKREVLPGLNQQPVVVRGSQEQVLLGTMGVVEVLQELADRGRLGPADFALPSAPGSARGVAGLSGAGPSSSSSGGGSLRARAAPALAPTPVVLMLDMGVTGYVIGKKGRRLAELQRATGARVSLAAKGGSLPGMRCGDRLLEISAETEEQRGQGLRAVLAAAAEAPAESGSKLGAGSALAVLVPVGAVGYVIGKGGQSLREIMSRFAGVTIEIQQDGPPIAGARTALISGPLAQRADVVLALVAKVDELRERLAEGASVSAGVAALPVQRGGPGFSSAPVAAAPAPVPAAAARSFAPAVSDAGLGSAMVEGAADPTATWTARTPAEKALLAGIQASGVLNHQLSVRVPEGLLSDQDVAEVARRSGARLEVGRLGADGAGGGHCFATAVGQRVSTSLAALYLQEKMARS